MIQSGGDIVAKERITLGQNASSVGTWTMTGGTARVTDIAVGHAGSGTFNLYDGEITTSGWVLVGFTNGKDFETPNTLNMYGGTINTNWFTMGWDYETSDGTMNMYGGELKTTGGNGIILAKTGSAEFNLYNGIVTSNTQLRLGQEASGVGALNIYAGDIKANGNSDMNANSSINFRTNSLGIGSLTIGGSFTQNNGQVTFAVGDGLTFMDGYSVENGIDIMTVGGKNAVTVTNETPDMATVAYDTNTGKLNMKLNDSLYLGSMEAESSSIQISGDGASQGWVTLDGMEVGNPYVLSLSVDTNDMDITTFVNNLNETLTIGDESYLFAELGEDSIVSMTIMPDLVEMMNSNVFAWNFTDAALFGANGVSSSVFRWGRCQNLRRGCYLFWELV